MAKLNYMRRLAFPCGYEIEERTTAEQMFADIKLSNERKEELPLCPLHGKNCKRGK